MSRAHRRWKERRKGLQKRLTLKEYRRYRRVRRLRMKAERKVLLWERSMGRSDGEV